MKSPLRDVNPSKNSGKDSHYILIFNWINHVTLLQTNSSMWKTHQMCRSCSERVSPWVSTSMLVYPLLNHRSSENRVPLNPLDDLAINMIYSHYIPI
jgi:hypothetical protein